MSVIDIRELNVVKELPTGRGTTWVAYSELGQAAYAVNAVEGTIQIMVKLPLKADFEFPMTFRKQETDR